MRTLKDTSLQSVWHSLTLNVKFSMYVSSELVEHQTVFSLVMVIKWPFLYACDLEWNHCFFDARTCKVENITSVTRFAALPKKKVFIVQNKMAALLVILQFLSNHRDFCTSHPPGSWHPMEFRVSWYVQNKNNFLQIFQLQSLLQMLSNQCNRTFYENYLTLKKLNK